LFKCQQITHETARVQKRITNELRRAQCETEILQLRLYFSGSEILLRAVIRDVLKRRGGEWLGGDNYMNETLRMTEEGTSVVTRAALMMDERASLQSAEAWFQEWK